MAAKPNYSFERRERDRLKAEKKAKRAADKKLAADERKSDATETPSESDDNTPT